MPNLTYNSENKRIATANQNGVANIPAEDSENERILILSNKNTKPTLVVSEDGFATIPGQNITEEYVSVESLELSVDQDGYASLGV